MMTTTVKRDPERVTGLLSVPFLLPPFLKRLHPFLKHLPWKKKDFPLFSAF